MPAPEFIAAGDKSSRHLLIALHGLGDSAAGYRFLPSMLGLPWMNYLLVNAPDSYFGGFSWYEFNGEPGPGIVRSRALVMDILEQQRAAGFPSSQTSLLGFSQGCLMTVDVGFRYAHRLAALVGISGYVHEPALLLKELSPAAKQQRMLFTHGTQDPLIPCAEVRQQVDVLRKAGLDITWREFVKAHTIEGKAEIDLIRQFLRTCHEDGKPAAAEMKRINRAD
ncbi:MAG: phospholipase/carboxylesterase [Verrucomicrobiota bacterium]|jgi:phospholipase/carboxylesterase